VFGNVKGSGKFLTTRREDAAVSKRCLNPPLC